MMLLRPRPKKRPNIVYSQLHLILEGWKNVKKLIGAIQTLSVVPRKTHNITCVSLVMSLPKEEFNSGHSIIIQFQLKIKTVTKLYINIF